MHVLAHRNGITIVTVCPTAKLFAAAMVTTLWASTAMLVIVAGPWLLLATATLVIATGSWVVTLVIWKVLPVAVALPVAAVAATLVTEALP